MTFRAFKLALVPILVASLIGQLALAWSQRQYLAAGYFDFVLYYSAAKILTDGKRRELYDLELQKAYQANFGVAHLQRALPFNHLPYELVIFLPFAFFSYPVAHALWAALNTFLLVILLQRLGPFVDPKHKILFGLLLFAYFPTVQAIKMGQDSIMSAFLLAEAFRSLKRNRDAMAGVLLALGLYKPQLVLPIAGVLLFRRRWRTSLAFVLTGAVLVGISFAIVEWRGVIDLISLWLSMSDRGHFIWPEIMTNLRGLLYITLSLVSFSGATNLLTVIASTVLYLWCVHLWSGVFVVDDVLFDLRFSLALVTTVLISFHLHSYDALLLVIPLILMFNYILKHQATVPFVRHGFFIVLIMICLPLVPNFLLSSGVLAWATLLILMLYFVIAMEICYRSRVKSSPV